MLGIGEVKDPTVDVIDLLSKMSDLEIRNVVEKEYMPGMTLLPIFAKYRNEKEFIYLIKRLSSYVLESILPKIFSAISRSSVKSEDSQRKMNCFHMILAHQSFDAILSIRNSINTSVLYDILTLENTIPEKERYSWRKVIALNTKLKVIINPKGVDKPISQAELLLRAFEDFIDLVDKCRALVSDNPQTFVVNTSKLTLQLCMFYQDKREEYLNWSLLHFICKGTHRKGVDAVVMRENASKFIRNLTPPILTKVSGYTCNDQRHRGCNLLHFSLLYVTNMDDIQTLCHRSDPDTLNKWLCERAQSTFRYKDVGLKNLSALQMMLLYLNLASIKSVWSKTTPKTFYFALMVDSGMSVNSDNSLTADQLLDRNPNINKGSALDELKQQIYGIRLFYELYHYFDMLKDKHRHELESRIAWVKKLMHFIENPPDEYVFSARLNDLYEHFKPLNKILLGFFTLRPFKDIINDICALRRASIVKESYHACKTLYHQFFMPEAVVAQALPAKPSSPKKVKISTPDNEVFEFDKDKGCGY